MCGEQIEFSITKDSGIGSPPRVRGTDRGHAKGRTALRITPACAGNSAEIGISFKRVTDHPRVCGEQCFIRSASMEYLGSPPRVRGTANDTKVVDKEKRITPACAGNRLRHMSTIYCLWDHSRVCGEQLLAVSERFKHGGSPPRVRGTGMRKCACSTRRGITPACAGNRRSRPTYPRALRDHPRVCGEQPNLSKL